MSLLVVYFACVVILTNVLVFAGSQGWCVCNHCAVETDPRKKICWCLLGNNCTSTVNSQEINDVMTMLNDDNIEEHKSIFTQTAIPLSINVCEPNQKRLICYRKLFRLLHGVGQTGNKVMLPSCVRLQVSTFFP
jgi:hypothetical protein